MQNVSTEQVAAKRNFHSLDGLRGVAALCVVMLHYGTYVRPLSIGSGYLAVDLFFALSGFVIGYAYQDRLQDSITPGRFFFLRLVRIYPLYLLGTALAIMTPLVGLVMHISHVWTWTSLTFSAVPALLLLPGPGQNSGMEILYPLNYPAWSLLVELIANVAYAVLLWTRAERIARILVIIAGVGCVAAISLYGNIDSGPGWSGIWISLVRVGFSFGVGVWIFRLYRRGRLPRFKVPPLLIMALVALLLVSHPPAGMRPFYDLACVLVLFPMCIIVCVVNEPKRGAKLFAMLGLISYPLYTIHLPASYVLSRVCDRLFRTDAANHAPLIGIGMIAFLSAVSIVLAKSYDPWARTFLARRLLVSR